MGGAAKDGGNGAGNDPGNDPANDGRRAMNANNFTDPQANGAPATADVQRLLPSNREAEEGVLCAMLLDPEAIVPRVFERLDERAFHFPENRVVFRGLVDLYY